MATVDPNDITNGSESGSEKATPEPEVRSKPVKPRIVLKPSRQTCIALGSLIGLTFLLALGLYAWQTKELSDLDSAAKAEQGKLESGESRANRLQRVNDEYNAAQSKLKYLETSVSANEYVPTLLKQMEELGKSVNLTVDGIRPTLEEKPKPAPPTKVEGDEAAKKAPPVPTWPYDKMHIEMQIHGTYWNMAKMLYRLNEFKKIIAVEGLQMAPSDAKVGVNTTPTLNATLHLTGFIFPDDGKAALNPALGKPGNPLPAGATPVGATPVGASPVGKSPNGTTQAGGRTVTTASGASVPAPPAPIPGTNGVSRAHAEQNLIIEGDKK